MKPDQVAQVIKTLKGGNCKTPSVQVFPCLAVLRSGSHIPLTWSSQASPHMASPQTTQTIWTFPEFHLVNQLFFFFFLNILEDPQLGTVFQMQSNE